MGNQQSSSQHEGAREIPNTACLLTSPNCFGKASKRLGCEPGRIGVHPKPTRSQSFRVESLSSKFTAFGADKQGRRYSYDLFPGYSGILEAEGEDKTVKTLKSHQRTNSSPLFTSSGQTSTLAPVKETIDSTLESPSPTKEIKELTNKYRINMNANLDKFAKQLVHISRALEKSPGDDRISRTAFQKYVVPHSPIGENYLWEFMTSYKVNATALKSSAFVQGAEKIYAPITDKDQISFYVKMYSKGSDTIDRAAFIDLLISSYQLSSTGASKAGRDLKNSEQFSGKEWFESVAKSCFHIKTEMSVYFVSNWILNNLARLFVPMHKYYLHQLSTGYTRMTQLKDSPKQKVKSQLSEESGSPHNGEGQATQWTPNPESMQGIDPILMWFLLASLPAVYLAAFQKKEDLLQQNLNTEQQDTQKWNTLYDSADQGLSINRFQHHVFNYRGPTIMIISCDDDYTFMVGIDAEWKESCHFWGGEQCFVIQLKPEFRVVEKGGKSLYANFSIRGYPFGIQAGKDPRNVSVEIKPDFEYVYFKKIPCRIQKLVVWGCGSVQTKVAQSEHKKWEAKECEKQKKINLNPGEWSDNPDKYLLELAGNYKSYGN
ncbi:unnamed protein product [Allacma fusca]|uniref:TLDc domain-containing protein n=1 Tax=Allacma fusca TaxID=39272 RepID=A0A8J2JFF9_9HEXA|nr:unnamed protein product [Allacma fusca]